MYFKERRKKLYLLLLFFAMFMFASSILIFSIGMNELAEVGIGSFIGEGNLDVSIAGEESASTILCSWGPNIGFYL